MTPNVKSLRFSKVDYCYKCGAELRRIVRPAHTIKVCMWFEMMPLDSEFDEKTGKSQYGVITKCPNKKWYNFGHIEFGESGIVTTDRELLEEEIRRLENNI